MGLKTTKKPAMAILLILIIITCLSVLVISSIKVLTSSDLKKFTAKKGNVTNNVSGKYICYKKLVGDEYKLFQKRIEYNPDGTIKTPLKETEEQGPIEECTFEIPENVKKFEVTSIGGGGAGSMSSSSVNYLQNNIECYKKDEYDYIPEILNKIQAKLEVIGKYSVRESECSANETEYISQDNTVSLFADKSECAFSSDWKNCELEKRLNNIKNAINGAKLVSVPDGADSCPTNKTCYKTVNTSCTRTRYCTKPKYCTRTKTANQSSEKYTYTESYNCGIDTYNCGVESYPCRKEGTVSCAQNLTKYKYGFNISGNPVSLGKKDAVTYILKYTTDSTEKSITLNSLNNNLSRTKEDVNDFILSELIGIGKIFEDCSKYTAQYEIKTGAPGQPGKVETITINNSIFGSNTGDKKIIIKSNNIGNGGNLNQESKGGDTTFEYYYKNSEGYTKLSVIASGGNAGTPQQYFGEATTIKSVEGILPNVKIPSEFNFKNLYAGYIVSSGSRENTVYKYNPATFFGASGASGQIDNFSASKLADCNYTTANFATGGNIFLYGQKNDSCISGLKTSNATAGAAGAIIISW